MVEEDYVSFGIAKLLKEKGFDEYCRFVYNAGVLRSVASLDCHWNEGYGELIEEKQNSDFGKYDNAISAPTLQMAMKWLREKNDIAIEINVGSGSKDCWVSNIIKDYKTENGTYVQTLVGFSYEEACESGIKYCLENLI